MSLNFLLVPTLCLKLEGVWNLYLQTTLHTPRVVKFLQFSSYVPRLPGVDWRPNMSVTRTVFQSVNFTIGRSKKKTNKGIFSYTVWKFPFDNYGLPVKPSGVGSQTRLRVLRVPDPTKISDDGDGKRADGREIYLCPPSLVSYGP